MNISAVLVGYEPIDLQGTGMASAYYAAVVSNDAGNNFPAFLTNAESILAEPNEAAILSRTEAELMPLSAYGGLARQISILWYSGSWYEDINDPNSSTSLLSGESYQQALMWPVAETHPSGAKQPGYGSWAARPL